VVGPGENRQLNAALHRIAVIQIRLDGLGRAYYQQRREVAIPPWKPSEPWNAASPASSSTS
jgi:hypothetical protein